MNLTNRRVLYAGLAVLGLIAASACSSGDDDTSDTMAPLDLVVPATTTGAGNTTVPAVAVTTAVPVATAAPAAVTTSPPAVSTTTSVPATTAAAACGEPVGDTSSASEAFDTEEGPQTNTGLIGFEAELGDHICFERFVITLQADPNAPDEGVEPGWLVGYDPEFEVCRDRAGQTPEVPGTHFICINIGSMLVTVPDNGGLPESMRQLTDEDEELITGAAWVESDNGQSTFLVGLNGEHGFIVRTLDDPQRLYIDVGLRNPG